MKCIQHGICGENGLQEYKGNDFFGSRAGRGGAGRDFRAGPEKSRPVSLRATARDRIFVPKGILYRVGYRPPRLLKNWVISISGFYGKPIL